MIVGAIANPYVLIAVGIVSIVSILFRWYYLKTARDIKRLEALCKCWNHFNHFINALNMLLQLVALYTLTSPLLCKDFPPSDLMQCKVKQ